MPFLGDERKRLADDVHLQPIVVADRNAGPKRSVPPKEWRACLPDWPTPMSQPLVVTAGPFTISSDVGFEASSSEFAAVPGWTVPRSGLSRTHGMNR